MSSKPVKVIKGLNSFNRFNRFMRTDVLTDLILFKGCFKEDWLNLLKGVKGVLNGVKGC